MLEMNSPSCRGGAGTLHHARVTRVPQVSDMEMQSSGRNLGPHCKFRDIRKWLVSPHSIHYLSHPTTLPVHYFDNNF